MRNYFASNRQFYFFDDEDFTSIFNAFTRASKAGVPAIYRPARVPGAWDVCPIVGHRSRFAIVRELGMAPNEREHRRCRRELEALIATYAECGRAIPLTAVAA